MTYHPSRAYVLTVAIAAEVFLIGAFRLVDASVAHDQAQLEWEKFLASEHLSGAYPSLAGSVSTVMPGDLTLTPSTSNSILTMAGGCGDIELLYTQPRHVVTYEGGACKPCPRGCAAIFADKEMARVPFGGSPEEITHGLDEVQRCVAGCRRCEP